jgi:hypothetical protein
VGRAQVISLYFEMAKHFTTLNTAAILVFLAASEMVSTVNERRYADKG